MCVNTEVIPNDINILGIRYSINEVDMGELGFEHSMGKWIESKQVILLNKNLPHETKLATLYHEITHVLMSAIGESSLSGNEDFVEKLSRVLFQTFNLKIEKNIDNEKIPHTKKHTKSSEDLVSVTKFKDFEDGAFDHPSFINTQDLNK